MTDFVPAVGSLARRGIRIAAVTLGCTVASCGDEVPVARPARTVGATEVGTSTLEGNADVADDAFVILLDGNDTLVEYDLGSLKIERDGADRELTCKVVNGTGHEVHLTSVVSSCGCTEASVTPDRLSPGEAARLLMTLSIHRAGSFRVTLAMVGDDEAPLARVVLGAGISFENVTSIVGARWQEETDSLELDLLATGELPPEISAVTWGGLRLPHAAPPGWTCAESIQSDECSLWRTTISVQGIDAARDWEPNLVVHQSLGAPIPYAIPARRRSSGA